MIAGRSASTASRMIISSVEISLHCIRLLAFHRFRFFGGFGVAAGEVVGARSGAGAEVAAGQAKGGEEGGGRDADNLGGKVGEGDGDAQGEKKGLGEERGGGEEGTIFPK